MFFQNSGNLARWGTKNIGKNILVKGTEIILDITFDSGSWGLCRTAPAPPCSLKTTCCPFGVRSAGVRHKASWLIWESQP